MNPNINFKALQNLSIDKHITFSFLALKRLFPLSIGFIEQHSFGKADIFEDSVSILYTSILNRKRYTNRFLRKHLKVLDQNIPSTDDYPNYAGTMALCSGIAFYEGIRLLMGIDVESSLIDISTTTTDAVDCYVQEIIDIAINDPRFEATIAAHPAMIAEIEIQNEIIDYLNSVEKIDLTDINALVRLQEPYILNLNLD